MSRITMSDLDSVVARINRVAGTPSQPYAKQSNGKFAPQANCYHLSGAYGGYALHQMSATEGCTGITEPLRTGHIAKRDLYRQMLAFCYGLESATESR